MGSSQSLTPPLWFKKEGISEFPISTMLIECNIYFWLFVLFQTICVVLYSIFLLFGLRHIVSF